MTVPITLHEDDTSKVVQISGEYYPTGYEMLNELKAFFGTAGINLFRLKTGEDEKIEHFEMSNEELDTLTSAWDAFKAEQEFKKLAEQKRIAGIIEEAHKLIEELPITITHYSKEEHSDYEWWDITCKSPTIDRRVYNAQDLLGYTKNTVERYQTTQTTHDEIKAIKESCPAIKIHGGPTSWNVTIPEPDIYGQWATTPEQLLERVKEAKAKYEEWLVEQDNLIRTND